MPRAEVGRLRRREQAAAAAEVGVTDLVFLGYPDGRVTPTIELRRDIARVIRQKRPQRVLSQWPYRNFKRVFASHPDHLAVGEAALSAVYPDARNPFAHMELLEQEGLEPHTVSEMWLMAGPGGQNEPDAIIDVTDVTERKLAALRQHESQFDDWETLAERVRGMLRANAVANGLGDDRYAESFLVVATG
jgi:LmbE family N-acetylglucosaminyl deacetylase